MRPISGWAHLMSSTVTVAPKTGVDTYGKPTYGTAVTYQCHVSRKRKMVRSASGQDVVSEQAISLNSNVNILPDAQVTMSTGDVGSTESWALHPLILSVRRRFDQLGPHSVVLDV